LYSYTIQALKKFVLTLPGLVVRQTWQYQAQIDKVTVPMVFSY